MTTIAHAAANGQSAPADNPTYKEAARRAATALELALADALATRFTGAVRRDADLIAAVVSMLRERGITFPKSAL